MLIKEYRIPLPLTVEEYRIAQLYMIQVSKDNVLLDETCILVCILSCICVVVRL